MGWLIMSTATSAARRCVRTASMQLQRTKQEVIEDATQRLIGFYHPIRIYLFGSEARGEVGPGSDLDFLVVVPDDTPEVKMRGGEVYSSLSGLGMPTDVIPWRESDFKRRAAWVRSSLPGDCDPGRQAALRVRVKR